MFETYASPHRDLRENPMSKDTARTVLQSMIAAKAAAWARLGYLDRAERILLPLVASPQASSDDLILMARIHTQQNRRDDAKRMLHQVLKLDPLHGEAQRMIVKLDSVPNRKRTQSLMGFAMGGTFILAAAIFTYFFWLSILNGSDRSQAMQTSTQLSTNTVQKEEIPSIPNEDPPLIVSFLEDNRPQDQPTVDIPTPTNTPIPIPPEPLSPDFSSSVTGTNSNPTGLTEKVITALRSNDLFDRYSLSVNQQAGIIQIAGEVPSLPIRFQLETLVRSVPGVQWVDIGNLTIAKTYTVSPGDSLWTIAQKQYGDPSYWKIIAKANGITSNTSIRTGQKVALPTLDESTKRVPSIQ